MTGSVIPNLFRLRRCQKASARYIGFQEFWTSVVVQVPVIQLRDLSSATLLLEADREGLGQRRGRQNLAIAVGAERYDDMAAHGSRHDIASGRFTGPAGFRSL